MAMLDKYDIFLFDCDGVLWREDDTVPGAVEVLEKLFSANKTVIFLTNNNSYSKQDFVEVVVTRLGIVPGENMLYSAGLSLVKYIKGKIQPKEKAFLVGSEGLHQTLQENDVNCIGFGPEKDLLIPPDFVDFEPDPNVKFVIGAFDPYLNYAKMAKASIYIRECGAEYISTNADINFPTSGPTSRNRKLPGTGSVLAGLTACCGVQPIIVGKPSTFMFELMCSDHNILDKSRVLMMGDNLQTDVKFGLNCGIDTALVLSGVTDRNMLEKEDDIKPNYVFNSIADLF